MPSRNRDKVYIEESFYHVYNRGVNKRRIFMDDKDYRVFLNLLKRYLDLQPTIDSRGREYPWLRGDIEVVSYCLMPNHIHLLVYVIEPTSMTRLLQAVSTSYSLYFNKKYKRVGHLFQERYKASRITNDSYLMHITRYIHLNPKNWRKWPFSSLDNFIGNKYSSWVQPERVLELFADEQDYLNFLSDYEDFKESLKDISHELADS